jgi:hypothetical protein
MTRVLCPLLAAAWLVLAAPVTGTPAAPGDDFIQAQMLFFGWYDNLAGGPGPGGDRVAHALPGRHRNEQGEPVAGGVGSYADPITAAVGMGNRRMRVGARLYSPYLKKYLVVEHVCPTCNPEIAVVVWLDSSNRDDPAAVRARAQQLTDGASANRDIIIDPRPGLPVDRTPLFFGRR